MCHQHKGIPQASPNTQLSLTITNSRPRHSTKPDTPLERGKCRGQMSPTSSYQDIRNCHFHDKGLDCYGSYKTLKIKMARVTVTRSLWRESKAHPSLREIMTPAAINRDPNQGISNTHFILSSHQSCCSKTYSYKPQTHV